MNKQNSKVVRAYLKEVSSTLVCKRSLKSVFLSELRGDVETYAEAASSVTREALYREFGTPDEISSGFFDRNDYDNLLKKAKRKALIWKLICVGVSILLIISICIVMAFLDINGDVIKITDNFVNQ